ncbi:dihydrofolate reductase family protein [Aliikangiella maris]|uniref:Dihydrofolate reductase family protein n=2 Tax=Aliikangiella maris TaxID=3162458 RepID=A0ABV2BS62_9GAMM
MDIKFCVFVAASVDGYIARFNGKLDWIESVTKKDDIQDYGYHRFMDSIDCVVMGRHTFEKAVSFARWPYRGKRVIVLSRTLKEPPADFVERVDVFGGPIELLAVELQHWRVKKVFVEGGSVIQSFLSAELLDELIITKVPILIGQGIPLFGHLKNDVPLKLTGSQEFSNGFIQLTYSIPRR